MRRTLTLAALATIAACSMAGARPLRAQHIVGGLHVGGPVRASLAVGGAWSLQKGFGREHGPFLLAEPGLRGHRASVGYLVMTGHLGSFVSGRASWLQLRRDGVAREYGGFELQVAPIFVSGGRLGAFVPLGSDEDRGVLWIADLSIAL